VFAGDKLTDSGFSGRLTQFFSLYRYNEKGKQIDNITQWALNEFRENYNDKKISREDIFHYVYGVLHNPAYRKI